VLSTSLGDILLIDRWYRRIPRHCFVVFPVSPTYETDSIVCTRASLALGSFRQLPRVGFCGRGVANTLEPR
jgi:hypothetical protein